MISPVGSTDHENSPVREDQVFTDILRQLYQAATPGIVANFFLALMLVWVLWNKVPQQIALYWLSANLLANSGRYFLTRRVVKKDLIDEQNWRIWASSHVLMTSIISITWGAAILLLNVPGEVVLQIFFILVVAGLTAGALPIVGIYFPSYVAYFLPTAFPLMWVLLAQGQVLYIQMAILVILYILTMLVTAHRYYLKFVESTKLRIRLNSLAHVDALTGLANRRSFDETLHKEWMRMMRSNSWLSLLIMDIDNFKEYNDSFGHQQGDECLKLIANAINTTFRRSGDFTARIGGEEFAVLLPDTKRDSARKLAEAARLAAYNLRIAHPGKNRRFASISIGVHSTQPKIGTSTAEIYAAADEALYNAKRAGKNRVLLQAAKQLDSALMQQNPSIGSI